MRVALLPSPLMAAMLRNGFLLGRLCARSSFGSVELGRPKPIPSIETPRGDSFGVHRRAVAVHSIRVTASTGIGEVVTLAPSAPAIVTGVTTQRPVMMRPELE